MRSSSLSSKLAARSSADRELQSAIARKFHCPDPELVRSFLALSLGEVMPAQDGRNDHYLMRTPSNASGEPAIAKRRKVKSRTVPQIARNQAGLPANLLRKFIAVGAGDSEVAAWMAARAQARKQNFFRWCRRSS